MQNWEAMGMPESMSGKTFLDVGCWEDNMCIQAMSKGSLSALGVDYCTSPELVKNLEIAVFNFMQLDIFSEKLLQLPEFDIVHCAGVFYHVENPVSLLHRLRKLCTLGGELYLESTYLISDSTLPVMLYHPADTFDDNVSNWWSPSERCLTLLLEESGFTDITVVHKPETQSLTNDTPQAKIGRIGIKAIASSSPAQIPVKLLPRRPGFMPQSEQHGSRKG